MFGMLDFLKKEHVSKTIFRWDWALFLSILGYMLLPRIYENYSVYLIGNAIPDASALPVVAQWSFVALAMEVVQEATVLPLFFFVGAKISSSSVVLSRIKTAIASVFLLSFMLSVLVFAFAGAMVELIGTPEKIASDTGLYIRVKALGIPFSVLTVAGIVLMESLCLRKTLVLITVCKVSLAAAMDSLFFGGYSFSLDWGVLGVAVSSFVADALTFILSFALIICAGNRRGLRDFIKASFADWRVLFRVGGFSGLDSLVRNLAYSFMIVRMVNLLGEKEIGGYYLTMHIFWSFMLVPALAFAESAKAVLANRAENLDDFRRYAGTAMVVSLAGALLFSSVGLFWGDVAGFFNQDPEIVGFSHAAFSILLLPYMLFIANTVCDSIFYALGRTEYMAWQSLLTNGIVYLPAFALYAGGAWSPSFEGVMMLFALGIFVDTLFTGWFAWKILFREKSSPTPA